MLAKTIKSITLLMKRNFNKRSNVIRFGINKWMKEHAEYNILLTVQRHTFDDFDRYIY